MGVWNTSELRDNGASADGPTCGVSLMASMMAATTLLSSAGSAVQQANANQCLNRRSLGSFVTFAASSRYSADTRNTTGMPKRSPAIDPHNNVLRVYMPIIAVRWSSGSFWTSGLLPNIASLNHSTSTML